MWKDTALFDDARYLRMPVANEKTYSKIQTEYSGPIL